MVSTDLLVVIVSVCLALVIGRVAAVHGGLPEILGLSPTFVSSAALVTLWMAALSASGSRSRRIVGTGVTEYRRIIHVGFVVVGVAGLSAYVLGIDGLQGFLAVLLPIGTGLLLVDRWVWRKWLAAKRRQGLMSHRALLVGSEASVASVARDLERAPQAGFRVVGACTPTTRVAGVIPGTEIPMSGSIDRLIEALESVDADTVVITSADELPPDRVRALSWQLEPGRQHLVLAPSLTDIGGPRLHTRPVAGLPLVHVETPRYDGGKIYAKRILDAVGAAVLVALLAPVLAVIALAVRLSSPGGVIFAQERIGLRGEPFRMFKFRSMYVDAEHRLDELATSTTDDDRTAGNRVLFKMRDDPRVTPIGRILRRYSLDELPQLFNVLLGSMSLVGPRPSLEREVAKYAQHVHRRFLVKPGVTGLWQVSGRSNLDWDESVRLDLFYVENWTMTGDLMILWRTAKAVFARDGAY
ncbi:sugar transferase [Agromyces intestinalis]|uniref:Sugar transferase n=1 Tax=Agromyces intestinalis TaxID=2592652 RepID=A0A5C1YLE9_9MICO|nr:sugar transferase [Agromyces intestinalis]